MSSSANNDLCIKLADAVVSNFNNLFNESEIKYEIDFENASKILDNFLISFYVKKDKADLTYEKSKKYFTKFLSYNYNFIKDKLNLSEIGLNETQIEQFIELFEDGPNKNWNIFHFIIVSYLSFTKQSNKDPTINYSGMIDKLMKKIEEFNDTNVSDDSEDEDDNEYGDDNYDDIDNEYNSENFQEMIKKFTEETNSQDLLNQLKEQIPPINENSSNVMKGLLGDIKGMLSGGGQNMDTQNILDLSKNLSNKYQDMIEKGVVNITDLFSGVIDLLNDPDAIGDEFNDFDAEHLPNPNDLISQMANDPSLKEAMSMMGGMGFGSSSSTSTTNQGNGPMAGLNMGMLGSLMSGMMGGMGGMGGKTAEDSNAPKTVQELEKEIERLMTELQDADPEENINAETNEKDDGDNNAEINDGESNNTNQNQQQSNSN
jgi:hypothetical protein